MDVWFLSTPSHINTVSGSSQCRVAAAVPHKDHCHAECRHTQLSCKRANSAMGSRTCPAAQCLCWASWPCWDPAWENYNMPTRIWTPLIFKVMSKEHSFCRGKGQGEGRKAHTWHRETMADHPKQVQVSCFQYSHHVVALILAAHLLPSQPCNSHFPSGPRHITTF